MAAVYITEHTEPSIFQGNQIPVVYMPPLATQKVAIAATATLSSAFNAKTRIVAVHTDAVCSIEFGSAPTATASSKRMAANTTEYFEVTAASKVSVITNS